MCLWIYRELKDCKDMLVSLESPDRLWVLSVNTVFTQFGNYVCTLTLISPSVIPLQGAIGARGPPGPPGKNGEDVSAIMPCANAEIIT